MKQTTPHHPAPKARSVLDKEPFLATASWPDLLQLAIETEGSEADLVEHVLRCTEKKQ